MKMEDEVIINRRLNNIFCIVFIITFFFLIITALLALLVNKIDFFIYNQIFIYFFSIVCTILFYKATHNKKENIFLTQGIFTSLAVRCLMVIVIYILLWIFQGGPFQCGWIEQDDTIYHGIALYLSQHPGTSLDNPQLFGLSKNYILYPYLVSFLYNFIYPHTLVARFANGIIGTLAIIPFYFFIKNLGMKENIARLATSFYIFSPGFIYFGSLQLKDTLLIFICFTLLCLASILPKTRKISTIVFVTLIYFIISGSLFFIRAQFFFLFALFYMFFFLRSSIFFKKNLLFILKLFIFMIVGIFIYKEASQLIEQNIERLAPDYILYEFMRYSKWQITSMFGFLTPVITSLAGFFLPFPTFVHLPYPDANYPTDIFIIPVDIEIFFISFITIFTIFSNYNTKKWGFKILLLMSIILYIGLIFSNFTTYERSKLLLISFSFIFVAFGIVEGINSKQLLCTCTIGSLFVFCYNVMRCIARGLV